MSIHDLEAEYLKYYGVEIKPNMYEDKAVTSWLFILKNKMSKDDIELFQRKAVIHMRATAPRSDEEMKNIATLAKFSHFKYVNHLQLRGCTCCQPKSADDPVIIYCDMQSNHTNQLDSKVFIKTEPIDPPLSFPEKDLISPITLIPQVDNDMAVEGEQESKIDPLLELKPIFSTSVESGSPLTIDIGLGESDDENKNKYRKRKVVSQNKSQFATKTKVNVPVRYQEIVNLNGDVRIIPYIPATKDGTGTSVKVFKSGGSEQPSAQMNTDLEVFCNVCEQTFKSVTLLNLHVKVHHSKSKRLESLNASTRSNTTDETFMEPITNKKAKKVSSKNHSESRRKIRRDRPNLHTCSVPDCCKNFTGKKRLQTHEAKCKLRYNSRIN